MQRGDMHHVHANEQPLARAPLTRSIPLIGFLSIAPIVILSFAGVQESLSVLCSAAMYGYGWTFFAAWIVLALLAMPLRVRGRGTARITLHSITWVAAWAWWILAVILSDLHSRADLLWFAYMLSGLTIAAWRLLFHGLVLGKVAQHALRSNPLSNGVLWFGQAELAGMQVQSDASVCGRSLQWLARHRARWPWARFHEHVFGPIGDSRILLEKAMQSTTGNLAAMRAVMKEENGNSIPRLMAVLDAFECETRLVLGLARRQALPDASERFAQRTLLVLEALALSTLRGSHTEALRRFSSILLLATQGRLVSEQLAYLVRTLFSAEFPEVEHALSEASAANFNRNESERNLKDFATVLMLCRHHLLRPAKGLLGQIAKHDFHGPRRGQAGRRTAEEVASAITSEIELRSASMAAASKGEGKPNPSPTEPRDQRIIDQRHGRSDYHGKTGTHPRFETSSILSHAWTQLPLPANPRELGAGTFALSIVACLWLVSVWFPTIHPLFGRIHEVRDVPFGGPIVSSGVQGAAAAGSAEDRTILLADPREGVRTLRLSNLRKGREGGPGTPLDGTVLKLGTNRDGSTLAIFKARSDESTCLSIRDSSGAWRPIIGPAMLDVDGSDLAAVIDGLPKPLFLLKTGNPRLLVYNADARALQQADVDRESDPIIGQFVDWCDGAFMAGERCVLLLTEGDGGGIYAIAAGSSGDSLLVRSVGHPPIPDDAKTIAVGPSGSRGVVAIDSRGRAWSLELEGQTPWVQLRAGSQGLSLEQVDAAAFTHAGRRIWLVQGGKVWTRALSAPHASPADSHGWASVSLPSGGPLQANERLFIAGCSAPGQVVVARTAGTKPAHAGFVVHLSANGAAIAQTSLHSPSEQVIDADLAGSTLLVHCVQLQNAGGESEAHRIDRIELGTERPDGSAPVRTALRMWSMPAPPDRAAMDGPILAMAASAGSAVALAHDGRFMRFDPLRDQLLSAVEGQPSAIARTPVRPDAIDGAIELQGSQHSAYVLGREGHVDKVPLDASEATNPQPVIDPGVRLPGSVARQATHALCTMEGAHLLTPTDLWRLDLTDAARHWTPRRAELEGTTGAPVVSRDSDGSPLAAWRVVNGGTVRVLRDGRISNLAPANLTELRPGLGVALFGQGSGDGLVRLSMDGSPHDSLVAPQSLGPSDVIEATIRGNSVDYLAGDRLHSASIPNGVWTASRPLSGRYRLSHLETPTGDALLVLPADPGIGGPCFAVPPGKSADMLERLGGNEYLTGAFPFSSGVIGFNGSELCWIDALAKRGGRLENRANQAIDLETVDEALVYNGHLLLRGRHDDGKRSSIVSYPADHQRAVAYEGEELSHIEIGKSSLFALDAKQNAPSILQLDPMTLERRWEYALPDGPYTLGLGQGSDPALLHNGAVWTLQPPMEPRRILAGGSPKPGAPPSLAVAFKDSIALFTQDGAWIRDADPALGFDQRRDIDGVPELIRIAPDGGSPWIRLAGSWRRLDNASRLGTSVGFLSGGTVVAHDASTGMTQPMIGGTPPPSFLPATATLGAPRAIEPVGADLALVVGDSGSTYFDGNRHVFIEGGALLGEINAQARLISRRTDLLRIHRSDGRVVEIGPARGQVLFGGAEVRGVFDANPPLAETTGGLLVDHLGKPLAALPESSSGRTVDASDAVEDGGTIVRLVGRGVERFDTRDMRLVKVQGLQGDALARCGDLVLTFDRQQRSVGSLQGAAQPARGPTIRSVANWYPSTDRVALLKESGEIEILSPKGQRIASPEAQPVPGKPLGNIPDSTATLVQVPDGSFVIFEPLAGKAVATDIRGSNPQIGRNGVYLRDPTGQHVLRIDADGRLGKSDAYEQIEFRTDGSQALIVASRRTTDAYEVLQLDDRTLQPVRKLFERNALFPDSDDTSSQGLTVVVVDDESTLLVSAGRIVLQAQGEVTQRSNPLGSSLVQAFLANGRIQLERPGGTPVNVAVRERGKLRLATDAELPAPSRDARSRFKTPLLDRTPIPTEIRDGKVPFGGSYVDVATGWVASQKPSRLVPGDSLTVEFADDSVSALLEEFGNPGQLQFSSPLKNVNGEIQLREGGRTIRLGAIVAGVLMGVHRTRLMAPLDDAACARVDDFGQLWICKPDAAMYIATGDFNRFRIDAQGKLHVQNGSRMLVLDAQGRQLVPVPDGGAGPELFDDATRLPGRCGSMAWKPSPQRDGSRLTWTMTDAIGKTVSVAATDTGFDIFSRPRLVIAGGVPSVQTGSTSHYAVAPIVDARLQWSDVAFDVPVSNPPQPQPLGSRVQFKSGAVAAYEDGLFQLRIDGQSFPYDLEDRRFASSICTAATAVNGQLVTSCLDGKVLLVWKADGGGAWTSPRLVNPPAGYRVQQLSPGDTPDSFVADLSSDSGAKPKLEAWQAGRWTDYDQPALVKGPRARWSWDQQDALSFGEGSPLRLVSGSQPMLACDSVELAAGTRPGDNLRSLSSGAVQYRGIGGQWFEMTTGTFPSPIEPPQPHDSWSMFSSLRVDRIPLPGVLTPKCVLLTEAGEIDIELRVKDGIIADIDGWNQQSLVPLSANAIELRSMSGKTSRRISLAASGAIQCGPPMAMSRPGTPQREQFDPFRVQRQHAGFSLSEGFSLKHQAFDFGVPGPRGFAPLDPDPSQMLPLGWTEDGRLVVSTSGRTIRFDPTRPLATTEEIEKGPALKASAWESFEGRPRFVVYARDGTRSEVDPTTFSRAPLATPGKDHLHCLTNPNDESLILARSGAVISATRVGAQPISATLAPATDQDAYVFEHWRASRIDVRNGAIETFSEKSVARYLPSAEGLRLVSVVPRANEAPAPQQRPLGGGLVATRSEETGHYALRVGSEPNSPAWPMSSLLGPARLYGSVDGGVLEANTAWTRRLARDGTITGRWPDRRGELVASADAYRNESVVVSEGFAYRLTAEGELRRLEGSAPAPARGQAGGRSEAGWEFALDASGATCEIRFDGSALAARDGALPMDMAVAPPPPGSSVLVIDRLGTEYQESGSATWAKHSAEHRDMLAIAAPTRLSGIDSGGMVRRFIPVTSASGGIGLVPPSKAEDSLQQIEIASPLRSWALGANVEIRFEERGMTVLTRVDPSAGKRYEYEPIPQERICESGRLAFDIPEDLLLAPMPGSTDIEACIAMRTGWEWPDPRRDGRIRALAVVAPQSAEPEFGPVIRPEWLIGSDIDASLASTVAQTSGSPIICLPFGERLFVVGEKGVVWIELGWRWHGLGMGRSD